MSVHPSAWNNSAPTRRIFMKSAICVFFLNLLRKIKFHENLWRITDTLHEDKYTFWSYLAHYFLEWEIFQIESAEKIETYVLCSVTLFSKKVPFMR
jgi:hypothetical protein